MGIYLIINEPDRYNADVMFSVSIGTNSVLVDLGTTSKKEITLGYFILKDN